MRDGGNMSSLEIIGSRIKNLREYYNLSREALCGDEKYLSSRQLQRIESGKSSAGIDKLQYIAQMLNVPVYVLLDDNFICYSNHYLYLKQELFNFYSHSSSSDLKNKDILLNELYDNYYENIHITEQLYIDCTLALMEILDNNNTATAEVTLEKYSTTLESPYFSRNDWVFLSLYFVFHMKQKIRIPQLDALVEKVTQQNIQSDMFYLEVYIRLLINIASYYATFEFYEKALEILNFSHKTTIDHKLYKRLPQILLLLAKTHKNLDSKEQSRFFYEQALTLSQIFSDQQLYELILKERASDF